MPPKKDIHAFDAILHLPHPTSQTHARMSMESRAAQFNPFAALTHYYTAVRETERLTSARMERDEETDRRLSQRLQLLRACLSTRPQVTFTYFVPDARKDGGAYVTHIGCVKKIDLYRRTLTLTDQTVIPIDEIYRMESALFAQMEVEL